LESTIKRGRDTTNTKIRFNTVTVEMRNIFVIETDFITESSRTLTKAM
jgi:hypothetical protein